MEDGLSTLSSQNLTAAVKCLFQAPLPESQFIKSKPTSTKDNTTSPRTVSYSKEQSQQNVKESHYVQLQPLSLPIYQTVIQNNQQHGNTSQPPADTSHVQQITLQQSQQESEDRSQSGSVNHKRKFSNDNIHLHQTITEMDRSHVVVSQSPSHYTGGTMNIQDSGLNTVIKQSVNNIPLQQVAALIGQRNNLLMQNPQVQTGANQANGLGNVHNVTGYGIGLSLLQKLLSSQNVSSNLNVGSLPVAGQPPGPVSLSDVPTEPPFSQLSPTQPLQNLIQNLFSNPESSNFHQQPQNTGETSTGNPVSYDTFETSSDLHVPGLKQKVTVSPTTAKDQDSTYITHINLLLEAISKNKTLSPQQYSQIQRYILGSNESHERVPSVTVSDQGQTQVLHGQGHAEMMQTQGNEPVVQLSQTPVQAIKSCPVILQRTTHDGHLQLIPLSRLDFEKFQQIPRTNSASTSSETDAKGPVSIQPKPTHLNVQGVIPPGHSNITNQTDINTVYNLLGGQSHHIDAQIPITQQEPSASALTNQTMYIERTSHFADEVQGTSPQEVGQMYPSTTVENVNIDQSIDGFSTDVQVDDQSAIPAENCESQEDVQGTVESALDDSPVIEVDNAEQDEEDNYIYCIDCRKLCKGSCEFHINVEYKSVSDTIILSRARASLPSVFFLQQSSTSDIKDQLGVWCKECINERTRFGPVIGCHTNLPTEEYKQQLNGFNPYQIRTEDSTTLVLELENEEKCNWTMFVQMAHSLLEQNCVLYKQVDKFFIVTTCEIKEEEELMMWFSKDLCLQLGISEDPGVVKMQQCEYCGKYFTTKKLLTSHSKVYHPHRFKYACSFDPCGKLFNTQTRLNNHMMTHMGMKPYECTRCGKRFSDASNLKAHMNIHTGVKKFQCEICGKTFRQKAHRDVHVITHTGDKKFKCSHCNKTFARQSDLKTHTYRHTNELQYPCQYCQKVFYKTQALKKHLKVHTGERNYMCGKCFKGFQTKYHRDRHLKICKERNGKEPSYMSLEEVAKLDSTCDAVPLKTVKPDDHISDQTLVENDTGEKVSHGYYG